MLRRICLTLAYFNNCPTTRPWSGLRHSCSCWRSVIHTRPSAKISSNVTFLLSVQSKPWQSMKKCCKHTHRNTRISGQNDGDIFLYTDIAGGRTRTDLCDISTLNQICQSSFHGNFAYIRAKFHDFLFGNLSDFIINHCLNSIRLRDSAVFQI